MYKKIKNKSPLGFLCSWAENDSLDKKQRELQRKERKRKCQIQGEQRTIWKGKKKKVQEDVDTNERTMKEWDNLHAICLHRKIVSYVRTAGRWNQSWQDRKFPSQISRTILKWGTWLANEAFQRNVPDVISLLINFSVSVYLVWVKKMAFWTANNHPSNTKTDTQ